MLYRTQTSIFTLKGLIFIKKHNKRDIQSQITLIFSRARAFWGYFQHLQTSTLIWGGRKVRNLTSKHIKANVCKNDCTCACNRQSVYLLYVNRKRQKWLLLLLNGTQYARQKKGGTQGQHRVVRSTQGGRRGVTLIYLKKLCNENLFKKPFKGILTRHKCNKLY